jgi:hypothetical protein
VALDVARDGTIHAAWVVRESDRGEIHHANTQRDIHNVFLPLVLKNVEQ